MSIIFRDGTKFNDFLNGSDLLLMNNDKEIVVDQMEDFEIEERIAIIKEIMNSEPVYFNLKHLNISNEPSKTIFGYPVYDNINSYKSR